MQKLEEQFSFQLQQKARITRDWGSAGKLKDSPQFSPRFSLFITQFYQGGRRYENEKFSE